MPKSKPDPRFTRLTRWLLWARPNSSVLLLWAGGIGAILFTVAAGLLVYDNTRRQIAAADWLQHTQDVLTYLQKISLLHERIDYRMRLYQLTGNEEQLNRVRASANQLETSVVHVKALVQDNPYQVANAQRLADCSSALNQQATVFTSSTPLPDAVMQQCQQIIGLMVDQEQALLVDRNKGSQKTSTASIASEAVFVAISLFTVIVLFSLLLRDAALRMKIGKQTTFANEQLALSVRALEDQANESAMLTTARDELQLCVDVQQVYQSAVTNFSRLLPRTSGSICMINNSRLLVEVVAQWSSGASQSLVEDFSPPESCCGLRSGQARWREPGGSELHCTHFSGKTPERYLCKPIVADGNTLGMLYVQCDGEADIQVVHRHIDGMGQLVQLAGMTIATLNLRTKLENQSIRDGLTGLFNRNFMQVSLERELSRAARRKQTLAIFMLDLDHFKKFNDTYGHAAGDLALKSVADIFRASVRTEDVACRYGGEEFTIMMPDVTAKVATDRAERIRKAVENLRLPLDNGALGEFRVSIGLALFPNDGEQADLLLRHADIALYRAKHAGRNQVAVYAEDPILT